MTESELAERIIAWLKEMEWEIYQEVQMMSYSKRADIVAVRKPLLWVIETKLSFGLSLLGQAMHWLVYANYVSIGFPMRPIRYPGETLLRQQGIGILRVGTYGGYKEEFSVREDRRPAFRRNISPLLKNTLKPEHKHFAQAGNNQGKFYSPFQATCKKIQEIVKLSPGIILKDLVESVDHHYASPASAKSAISKWAQSGVIVGVQAKREGKFVRFFPEEKTSKSLQRSGSDRI